MARKEFVFAGKTIEELTKLSINEFAEIIESRARRKLKRGMTEQEKKVLKKLRANKTPETHARTMIILPEMVSKTVKVHDGRNFVALLIEPEMIGHRLGEFAMTRKRVTHHAPGIGATRSSASLSVR